MASLAKPISQNQSVHTQLTDHVNKLCAISPNLCFSRTGSFRQLRIIRSSVQSDALFDSSAQISDVPLLSCEEAIERMNFNRANQKSKQQYLAMYSSTFGGITTDPAAMVISMDDHMVHRGHGVFDTAAICDGKGSLRYWLSAGVGDFQLSPAGCHQSTFYAIVIQDDSPFVSKGVKVITSSIPIKPPQFATMKSVNYLPNVLSKMEAEETGAFAAIWLDGDGFIAEGPNMNVAFVTKEKELLMPHFDKILSGCTANRVLTLAEALVREDKLLGIKVGNFTVEEGKKAEEMMLLGSGVLVRPVVQWDEQIIGNGKEGPIAQALLDLILEDMKSGPPSVRVPVPY